MWWLVTVSPLSVSVSVSVSVSFCPLRVCIACSPVRRACEDALRATETLPNYPKCWLKAGDALAALRKPKEAAGYYQVALDLDASMESYLKPKIAA